MLLRRYLRNDPGAWIAVGQLSLVIGLVAQRFIHPPSDFWQGFTHGLSAVLIGISIVFNLRGLVLWRRTRC